MRLLITSIFLFLLCITSTFAQHDIKGKVTDEQNQPLPFANIIVYTLGDVSPQKGTVSSDNGDFNLKNIPEDEYIVEISMLGFETKKIEAFQLKSDKIINVILKEESHVLNEVVVKNKRPVIKQTAEKLVVDLENSEMVNTNLQDVMRKVPGVLVTNNGITIAGNSGVRILINGKTTEYMDVETLLRDFPADNIAKIEVVEQPGAEYEASGTGAIINIILKKNVQLGTHGSANAWIGEDEGFEYGAGFSMASYKNKLNWQTSANFSKPTWRDDLSLIRTVGDETYDQFTEEPYDPSNLSLSASADYYINDKNSFGIGGSFSSRISDRTTRSETIISDADNINTLFSENSFDRERYNFNINPYYEFKTEKDKLVIDFNYVDYSNDNTNFLYDTEGSTIDFTDRKYIQNGEYNIKTYKADYSKTISDSLKISAGTRYAAVKTDNDLQSFIENNGDYDLVVDESSQFLIDETIFALYTKVNATLGRWSFSGGLRYEDSNTDGTSTFMSDDELVTLVQKRPIKKVFPSASVSRKLTEQLGASVSYSYRIQRPSYNSLNSFTTFLDPFSAGEGNPNLTPSYTNNYQFNLTYDGQPFFTIGYSKTDDVIFELISQDNSTAQIRQQDVNVEENSNWNFRLFAPLSFTKGLEGYTGIIVTNTDFQSSTYGIDLNKWNLIWFTQASYQLPLDINFEVSANYGTGALESQIDVDWFANLDFSFGKKFLDDKLKLNLGFNKMLNRGFVGTIDYGNGTAFVDSNGSRQNIQLRCIYSFGSKFGKKSTSRNTNNDEENRIGDDN
ncbi:TonB-dependent receptor [Cellulophaga baltica]|uniref:outer membrane beta-barrel protein n=1 Tax=Cellulophaga TaxID=104264 RepID=UPI001C06A544|nr:MULTISPECIES: outer membrane beta-barrel protein [Cellulophaga]MBU2995860.1 TonB-dependent receptor [Cellulophaga baltica]MDO6767255.1 TonB-dependent receptor [Cellulophaga sp. 1_MG-2023]